MSRTPIAAIIGINRMLAVGDALVEWSVVTATTLLAMLPPVAVVILMQRSFIAGMTETEK
jgi:sn-glycerol 3-phosphate transport system permease protein